jgi:hypothetical protein
MPYPPRDAYRSLRRPLVVTLVGLGVSLTAALGLGPSRALAEATVLVEVRPPADGTVTITPNAAGSRAYTCTVTAGHCTIAGVPGGMATVRFQPSGGGAAPPPHVVMIAPTGTVRLTVPSGR